MCWPWCLSGHPVWRGTCVPCLCQFGRFLYSTWVSPAWVALRARTETQPRGGEEGGTDKNVQIRWHSLASIDKSKSLVCCVLEKKPVNILKCEKLGKFKHTVITDYHSLRFRFLFCLCGSCRKAFRTTQYPWLFSAYLVPDHSELCWIFPVLTDKLAFHRERAVLVS